MNLGDEVLIRLQDDLERRIYGPRWRIGMLVGLGVDLLANEPVYELNDGGPRIYAAHIDFATVLQPADPTPLFPPIYRGN